jgi:hypothetical protein
LSGVYPLLIYSGESLAGLAGAASETGQWERAARLFGAVQALLVAIGASLSPHAHVYYERQLAATRAQLDQAAFAAAWSEGLAMPLDEVIAYALLILQ